MKKILSVVVILAAILLVSYYGMGMLTEHSLKKTMTRVNQSNGITVKIVQYDRGFFKSLAKLDWNFHVPEQVIVENGQQTTIPASDYHIDMPVKIMHGPIIFADNNVLFGLGYASTDLSIQAEYEKQFDAQYTTDSVKPKLNLAVYINYFNKSHIHIAVPAFKLISKQGMKQFDWLGMVSDVNVSSKMKRINGHLVIDGINLVKDNTKAVLGNIESDYDLSRNKLGLYTGDANLLFPTAVVMENNNKVFEVKDFEIHTTSSIKNNLFTSTLMTKLNELFTQRKIFGPCKLSMAIRNIDAEAIADINNKINLAKHERAISQQQLFFSVLPDLPKLLAKGAEFQISELNIGMPKGVIKGDLLIAMPNENVTNPLQMIQKLQGNGNVVFSSEILKELMRDAMKRKLEASINMQQAAVDNNAVAAQNDNLGVEAAKLADQKIDSLVKSQVLLIKGTDYVLGFKFEGGKLLVNDKPFDPSMMQF